MLKPEQSRRDFFTQRHKDTKMLFLAKLRQAAKKSVLVLKSNISSRLGDLRERQNPVLTTNCPMEQGLRLCVEIIR